MRGFSSVREPDLLPMKAVSGDLPHDDAGWAYEIKWDGMRILTFAGSPPDVAASLLPYVEAGCRDLSLLVAAETWEAGVDLAAEVRYHLIKIAGPGQASE